MVNFEELNSIVTLADQMRVDDGPITLLNLFTVDADEEDELVAAWTRDADFMKIQPGYISTQLHKGLAGSTTYMNYAVWEDVASFRNAFLNPEFQRLLTEYPKSAVARPHLFNKMAVKNHCTI